MNLENWTRREWPIWSSRDELSNVNAKKKKKTDFEVLVGKKPGRQVSGGVSLDRVLSLLLALAAVGLAIAQLLNFVLFFKNFDIVQQCWNNLKLSDLKGVRQIHQKFIKWIKRKQILFISARKVNVPGRHCRRDLTVVEDFSSSRPFIAGKSPKSISDWICWFFFSLLKK